jgi:hypothetical protein
MVLHMRETSRIMRSMEKEYIFGKIIENMMEIGKITRCMEVGYSLGKMERNT